MSPITEDFHDIISERYERRSTLLTSNLDLSEWGEFFQNRLFGVATLDRLRHGAYTLTLDGKSYRVPKLLPESSKPEPEKESKNKLAKGVKNVNFVWVPRP